MAALSSSKDTSLTLLSEADLIHSALTEDYVMIEVKLVGATDLPASDIGLGHMIPSNVPVVSDVMKLAGNIGRAPCSDPYVVVKLLNVKTGEESEEKKVSSEGCVK